MLDKSEREREGFSEDIVGNKNILFSVAHLSLTVIYLGFMKERKVKHQKRKQG